MREERSLSLTGNQLRVVVAPMPTSLPTPDSNARIVRRAGFSMTLYASWDSAMTPQANNTVQTDMAVWLDMPLVSHQRLHREQRIST
ncbi:hypothetical protein [Paraburkholderia azotifigens]|uniref:Uncharacterized protein n=1 Tax=Paraburkholderia azotifigens TaxID=2057004 RepID=A0A5C6VD32_9BURK|nr:hypothetical protein [Paraburkholderia azotifigens]TXC83167.1 hypothetical protein FRZ40_22450 [Paraburkholderia azotifigens]